jgi:hypothetical protein
LKLFLDNDIILKLGSIGFLDELEKIFVTNSSSIYVLPSAFHFIKNNKKLRLKYSEESLQSIIKKIKTYQEIPDEFVDDVRFISLVDIEKIDAGERVLFALNPPENDFLILTGDKRSLEQLSMELSESEIIDELNGKIVCLEYLIAKILELRGIQLVERKMKTSNFGGDTELKLIFNQQTLDVEKVNEGLMSFYNILKEKTKDLLCLIV